ncbi:Cysteine-rich receptor-like protein kinase [Dionaea muscipula]
MASLLYIVAIITVSSVIKPSNQAHMVSYFCSGKDTYYKDSTYQTNLVSLFTELASVASLVRSYDAAAGSGSDRVHAFFYCRHDLKSELCQSCVRNASESIMQLCLYETEATIWNEECTLRYAGQSVVQSEKEESSPWAWWYDSCGVKMVSSRKQLLNKALTNLIKGLVNKSTSGDKPKLFAKGEAFVTMRETLYELVLAVVEQDGQWRFCQAVK